MDKLASRSQYAARQATRRLSRRKQHVEKGKAWERRKMFEAFRRSESQLICTARVRRREDWETGLLAPRRAVGEQAETYGGLDYRSFNLPEEHPERKPDWYHIMTGDRVVVTKGRERGKIGEVEDLNKDRLAVKVKGVNKVDVVVPESLDTEDGKPTVTISRMIPLSHVKLVYPLPDPQTGVPRDVILDHLEAIGRTWDRKKREYTQGERVISGTNTIIPWPEQSEPEHQEFPGDTMIDTVDNISFRPHLLTAPMPLKLVDELRNKYSKFRTRHDWEYLRQKETEVMQKDQKTHLIQSMRTPLQELAHLRAEQRKKSEQDLSVEQLARIGKVIAKEQLKAKSAIQDLQH